MLRAVVLAPWLVMLAGCQPSSRVDPGSAGTVAESPDAELVTVSLANRQDFDAFLAQCAGHVVLVDYWATWCDPCQRQFPHTVQLHRAYESDGLRVVSVCLDDPGNSGKVLEFLQNNRATFTNFLSAEGTSQKSFDDFEIAGGALPFYQLFDRQGRLRDSYEGRPTGIERRIEQLLAEPPQPESGDL
jgi:thiol-disulfide isomerase/thioredoxin